MKKLLIFMLVLCMASLANATLQISVNGNMNPTDSDIWLLPTETLNLDVWTNAEITPGTGEGYWALIASTAGSTISGGVVLVEGEGGLQIYGAPVPAAPAGENGIWGAIALATIPSISADTVIFDEILFHCEAEGDVTVTLLMGPAPGAWSPVDSVVIHQIPEPMTVLLLGLGGLFLRRRK